MFGEELQYILLLPAVSPLSNHSLCPCWWRSRNLHTTGQYTHPLLEFPPRDKITSRTPTGMFEFSTLHTRVSGQLISAHIFLSLPNVSKLLSLFENFDNCNLKLITAATNTRQLDSQHLCRGALQLLLNSEKTETLEHFLFLVQPHRRGFTSVQGGLLFVIDTHPLSFSID